MVDRGCPAAVVRVWESGDDEPKELCGEELVDQFIQMESVNNVLRISFITADRAVGAKGFKAVWTEIYDGE